MDRGEVFRAHPCTEVQCTRQQGYFFSLRRPSISVIDDDSSLLFPSSAVAEHNSYTFWIDSKHLLHLGKKKKIFLHRDNSFIELNQHTQQHHSKLKIIIV